MCKRVLGCLCACVRRVPLAPRPGSAKNCLSPGVVLTDDARIPLSSAGGVAAGWNRLRTLGYEGAESQNQVL
jgi:hypothetical protein